jgi:hypothetical protein
MVPESFEDHFPGLLAVDRLIEKRMMARLTTQ